jgi:predicted dehydrogenase
MVDRFHPATLRLKEIVDSGELGTLTKIEVNDANLAVPSGFIKITTFVWYMSWVVVA